MVPLDTGWSDVGSWASLVELSAEDEAGNAAEGDVILHDTPDVVFVAGKRSAQDVKRVVERLEAAGRDECRAHRKVYRPWGSYDAVRTGEGRPE